MYRLKKYSRAWLSVIIIVLAGYAGLCLGYNLNSDAGPCNAKKNGVTQCSESYGCCLEDDQLDYYDCKRCEGWEEHCEAGAVSGNKRNFYCVE